MQNAAPDTTEDNFLDARLRIRQPRRGYRAGLDAVLLASAVHLGAGSRGIEAGCGPGAALLCAARLNEAARFLGVEREDQALGLCADNILANGLQDRCEVRKGDIADRFVRLGLSPFDAAFSHPPFFDDHRTLRAPAPERRAAWMADDGLEAWTRFLLGCVREGGEILIIHRADRLGDLLGLLAPKAGSFQILPVHPFADAPAKRVIVRAIKTGKAPLRLLPGLVLHERPEGGEDDGSPRPPVFSARTDAILRGRERITWLRP